MTAAPATKRPPTERRGHARPAPPHFALDESPIRVSLARRVERIYFLLRYHRAGQLARRLRNHGRSLIERILGRFSPLQLVPSQPIVSSPRWLPPPAEGLYRDQIRLGDFERGEIELLNQSISLGGPFDWTRVERECQRQGAPRLWRFHLHYHEYLAEQISRKNPESSQRIAAILGGWCRAFPAPDPASDAWHPYCIARRIPAWTRIFSLRTPAEPLRSRLLCSIARQADWLARHLETDLGGNHLWENGRALAIAGAFFAGPAAQAWRRVGLAILDRCLEEQILPSGEHFERSPAYQLRLAAGLVELANWLALHEGDKAKHYRAVADGMFRFLDQIRHPDGMLPLFGDSTLDPPGRGHIFAPPADGWVGDYFVHRSAGDLVLFDAGDLGPDHLPAHAHADLLGCEISLGGRRVLVDSGTCSYEGPKRGEYRSARAHNVLVLDDVDHADHWSNFRMGRRGHVVHRASGELPEGRWVRAAHDAYRHLGVPLVERIWFLSGQNGPWFSVHIARGRSRRVHVAREFLHWHPEAGVAWEVGDPAAARLPGGWNWELASPVGCVVPGSAHYSPDFHVEVPAVVFELRQEARLPLHSAWALTRGEPAQPRVHLSDGALALTWWSGGQRRRAVVPLTPLP